MYLTTAARAARMGSTGLLGYLGNAPVLKIYDGTPPADANTALSGNNLLVSITGGSPAFTQSNGVLTISGTPSGTAAATGIARFARMFQSDGTTLVWQQMVSQAYVNSKALVLNQHISNSNGIYRVTTAGTTSSSGTGPTGTGTGITDGTAVFAFVQAAVEITLTESSTTTNGPSSIASGATVTFSGNTITDNG